MESSNDAILQKVRTLCATDNRFVPGTMCWLWGLQPASLRNCTMGVLLAWMPERGRWQVEVHNLLKTAKEKVAIKPENLAFYQAPVDCAICMSAIVTDSFVTSCNHFFHGECMKQATTESWKSSGRDMALHCPVCREWVGCKTELGFIKQTPLDLVHGVLSHTYQKIAQEIKCDDSAESECAVTGMWHSNLFEAVDMWEVALLALRDKHLANPTRETGKALADYIMNLLDVAYGRDKREKFGCDSQDTLLDKWLPKHAYDRAMAEGRNWLISLLGVYAPFLGVPEADEHPDGSLETVAECLAAELDNASSAVEVSEPEDVMSLASSMSNVEVTDMKIEYSKKLYTFPTDAADDEVAAINTNRVNGKKKRKKKEKSSKQPVSEPKSNISVVRRPGTTHVDPGTGKETCEFYITMTPELVQYIDPDLLGCETADQLLLLHSLEQRLPSNHPDLPRVQSIIDIYAKGNFQNAAPAAPGDSLGLGGLRKEMVMRLGPPEGGRVKSKETLTKEYEAELNRIVGKGAVDAPDLIRVDKIIEETPGDPMSNLTVHFSSPVQYTTVMQAHGWQ